MSEYELDKLALSARSNWQRRILRHMHISNLTRGEIARGAGCGYHDLLGKMSLRRPPSLLGMLKVDKAAGIIDHDPAGAFCELHESLPRGAARKAGLKSFSYAKNGNKLQNTILVCNIIKPECFMTQYLEGLGVMERK